MNKKLLCALTCVAWTATYECFELTTVRRKLTQLKNGSAAVANIFNNDKIIEMIGDTIATTDSWVRAALSKNKSDTLSSVYSETSMKIQRFFDHFKIANEIFAKTKNGTASLQDFMKSTNYFSVDREALKQILAADNTLSTFKTHKKPFFRPQTREDAKQEIVDVLFDYVAIFTNIAQKAINDAANINAAKSKKELEGIKKMPKGQASGANPFLNETAETNDESDEWSDW